MIYKNVQTLPPLTSCTGNVEYSRSNVLERRLFRAETFLFLFNVPSGNRWPFTERGKIGSRTPFSARSQKNHLQKILKESFLSLNP